MNEFVEKTEATAKIIVPGHKPITVIGNDYIRNTLEAGCIQQAINIASAPGVDEFVINPDAHWGYGTCVGSVFSSREMVYPCAVGPDVKCSMSLLQTNIPSSALKDKKLRRAIIKAIEERIPLGIGNNMPSKARPFDPNTLLEVATSGATQEVLKQLNIPVEWISLCEDPTHGERDKLAERLDFVSKAAPNILNKLHQLGGIGGGNHFVSCDKASIIPGMEHIAQVFGIVDDYITILNHFGSRGFGFMLTSGGKEWPGQFRLLADKFGKWAIPFPGGDNHNVYCPVGTKECDDYLNDMALGANFATVNHLLVCQYVLEAFTEVLGDSVQGYLVYYIAHNIIRREIVDKSPAYVHRKGATRAFPAGHFELKDTPFYKTGHPILLPGNPVEGSTIMVGERGSRKALNSVNHGAGRAMSRTKAAENIKQKDINAHMEQADIVSNCRNYPVDEAPAAYKNYSDVIDSVQKAGLASLVARLKPVMNIKDNDTRKETSA
jgi:tRNA-splicing ligase RtcB